MAISCYLCNRKASKTDDISLHRFPKNVDLRSQWLKACGLTANDDVRRTCICSRHFRTEDICKSNIFGRVKSSIKRNAVPTLCRTKPLKNEKRNESPSKTLDITKKSPEKIIALNCVEVQMSDNSNISIVDPEENDDFNQCIENMTESISEGENTVPDGDNFSSQCRKRIFFEPRHVSEILESDFSTPKKANRTIQLIKRTDHSKSQKIKRLQRQARGLQKRVKSLQDLINQLKNNRMVTDESGNALMSMMPENLTSITNNMNVKDHGVYTPQVRSFALTLYFYSPKAYNYVRETFNKKLPSLSTIKSWNKIVNGSPGFTDESFKAIELQM